MHLLDFLGYEFIQNALAAAVLVSIACGLIGPLVLASRMSSLVGGVAHAAYGGLGIALYFALPAMLCSLGFASVCALLIAYLSRSHPERADAAVAVIWAFGMSIGVFFADLSPGSTGAVMSYLFGAILATSSADLAITAAADLLIFAFVLVFIRQLSSLCIDREFARASGILESFLHYSLVLLASLAVIVCLRAVGVVLIVALLSIPAYIASIFCLSLPRAMALSCALSLLFCCGGLALSVAFDFSASGCIILLACLAFMLALCFKRLFRAK